MTNANGRDNLANQRCFVAFALKRSLAVPSLPARTHVNGRTCLINPQGTNSISLPKAEFLLSNEQLLEHSLFDELEVTHGKWLELTIPGQLSKNFTFLESKCSNS